MRLNARSSGVGLCPPMVVKAYGAWGTEDMESMPCLASCLATAPRFDDDVRHYVAECTMVDTSDTAWH